MQSKSRDTKLLTSERERGLTAQILPVSAAVDLHAFVYIERARGLALRAVGGKGGGLVA